MRSVVVTGASSGIGRACALTLDRNRFRVFAGVRKSADGEALKRAASDALTPVHIDVTDAASIEAMSNHVAAEVGDAGLTGLINNAGTTLPCPVEYLPPDGFRRQMEVNLVGPLVVTQALLPLLVRGRGRLVNVTSAAGKAGVPLMAPYVAAKHGLGGLSDVLRLELGWLGVHVAVIEPGFVATAMRDKLQRDTAETIRALPDGGHTRYGARLTALADSIGTHAAHGSQPDVIADAVLHALTSSKPRTRYPAGRRGEADAVPAASATRPPVRPHHPACERPGSRPMSRPLSRPVRRGLRHLPAAGNPFCDAGYRRYAAEFAACLRALSA